MIPREEVKIIGSNCRSLMIFKGDLNSAQKWEGDTRLTSALIKVGKAARGMCSSMHCWS